MADELFTEFWKLIETDRREVISRLQALSYNDRLSVFMYKNKKKLKVSQYRTNSTSITYTLIHTY
jgi:hypothetical protein